MKNKNFYALLLVLCFVFAALTTGGCGGSSSSNSGSSDNAEDASMAEVFDDDAAVEEIISRVGIDLLKLVGLRQVTISVSNDQTIMEALDLGDSDPATEAPYNSETVRAHYTSGDVILIEEPDLALINKVRGDLGLEAEDSGLTGASGSLEIYALALRSQDGIQNSFSYVVPRLGDISVSTADYDTEDAEPIIIDSNDLQGNGDYISGDKAGETAEDEYTMWDFQIDRCVRFFQWLINMEEALVNNSRFASAYTVRAAADNDLVNISKAQVKAFDFSVYDPNRKGWSNTGDTFKYDVNRAVSVNYSIYAVHSFSNHDDYYLVICNASTTPKNFGDTYRYKKEPHGEFKYNFLYGYTRSFSVEQHIDNGNMSVDDVALVDNALPNTLNQSKTYSESFTWNASGKLGLSKDGLSGELSGGVSHTNSISWTVSEYILNKQCYQDYKASAKWYVDMNMPSTGSRHGTLFDGYVGVNATNASRNALSYQSEWAWRVAKSYWQNHSSISMNVKSVVQDGYTHGESRYTSSSLSDWFATYVSDRNDSSYTYTGTNSLVLEQPVHLAASVSSLILPSKAEGSRNFTILSENDWTLKSNADWLKFTSTSGTATGATEYAVLFDVDENTTSSPRQGTITLSDGKTSVNIQVLQSGK